jgi:ADP-dependent NAD(P)H-hydrate dehydratase
VKFRFGNSQPDLGHITPGALRDWPLPVPAPGADGEDRRRTLIVAGSAQTPGSAILASLAALRSGAGQLCIATARSVAATVALAVPESRVIGLRETPRGGVARLATGPCAGTFDAMLVGPGMQDADATARLIQGLRARFPKALLQLDACAISALENETVPWDRFAEGPVLITPQATELASLAGSSPEEVVANSVRVALKAARQWRVTVLLKGATAHVATPDGQVWSHPAGRAVRATSGAGDVLSGIVAGLLARGCKPEQAAVWGLALHAEAGEVLARRIGPVGYLARELTEQIPELLRRFAAAELRPTA